MHDFTIIQVYTSRIAKQHDELLISILLLILIIPIYLGMCPSVSTCIHSYMSKLMLLLETNDETNGLCLEWVPYILGTTAHYVLLLLRNLPRGELCAKGLTYIPYKKLVIGVTAHPIEHLEAHR